jgi:hypothetical protein
MAVHIGPRVATQAAAGAAEGLASEAQGPAAGQRGHRRVPTDTHAPRPRSARRRHLRLSLARVLRHEPGGEPALWQAVVGVIRTKAEQAGACREDSSHGLARSSPLLPCGLCRLLSSTTRWAHIVEDRDLHQSEISTSQAVSRR